MDKKETKNLRSIYILAPILLVIAFVVIVVQHINYKNNLDLLTELNQQYENSRSADTSGNEELFIGIPTFDDEVFLVNEPTVKFLETSADTDALSFLSSYRAELGRMDEGLSVVIELDILGGSAVGSKYISRVEISSNSALIEKRVFDVTAEDKTLEIKHLETGKDYTCKLILSTGETLTTAFKTADTPRILSIEGIVNVRDIGGWKTFDGKRIKQGLLYRGSEIDGAVQQSYNITEDGAEDMLEFGIKYDLDLRASTDCTDEEYAFGENVIHKYYDAPMYDKIFDDYGKRTLGSIFKDISNPDNYPMYLHCTYGVDRTGTVCYLLESLLGVPEDSLLRDYKLSGLFHEWLNTDGIIALNAYLNQNYQGETLSEKVENYLLDCGVTNEEIESIRSVFLVEEADYN